MNAPAQNKRLGLGSRFLNIAALAVLLAALTAIQTFLIDSTARRFGIGEADLVYVDFIWSSGALVLLSLAGHRLIKR
jgi:hypothetical protein